MDWFPLTNSLRIAAISCVIVFFTGIASAYYVAKLPRVIKGFLGQLFLTLPLVCPRLWWGIFFCVCLGQSALSAPGFWRCMT